MALIRLSAIGITALSGTTGGTVFAFNRGGKYTRNWAKPTNPQSSKQTLMRSIFGYVSQLWGSLDETKVQAWENAGANQQRTNAIGEEHAMNGFSYFKAVNQNRLHSGWTTALLLPPDILPIPAVISTNFDISGEPTTLAAAAEFTLGDSVPAGDYVASIGFAIVSANQNRSYGSVKNKFKDRIRVPIPAGNQIDVSTEVSNYLLGKLTGNEKVFLQLHIHSSDGQKGPEVTAECKYNLEFVLNPTSASFAAGGDSGDISLSYEDNAGDTTVPLADWTIDVSSVFGLTVGAGTGANSKEITSSLATAQGTYTLPVIAYGLEVGSFTVTIS